MEGNKMRRWSMFILSLTLVITTNPQCGERKNQQSNPCVRISQGSDNVNATPENCRK